MTITLFRYLLTANIAAAIASITLDMVLSPEIDDANLPVSVEVMTALSAVYTALVLVTLVALWRFARWARLLAVFTTLIGLVTLAFSGPIEVSAAAFAGYHLASYTWGAILAAAYWTPINDHFRRI